MQTARVFMNDNSQAVRLPKKFHFEEEEVVIKWVPTGPTGFEVNRLLRRAGGVAAQPEVLFVAMSHGYKTPPPALSMLRTFNPTEGNS